MWYEKRAEDAIEELGSDAQSGLSEAEAERRLAEHGPNQLDGKRGRSLLARLFAQINDVLIYVLIAAAAISWAVGETADAIIIALVVALNAVVGVVQESKAEQALEALKQLATPKALVKRDGDWREIPSEQVVPGDLVSLDAGRYVPCDLRLLESANLKIEESALTGESVPVDKDAAAMEGAEGDVPLGDQRNMAFLSTLATYGRGVGLAVATGMQSEIGKIASMLNDTEDEATPLQKSLAQVGKSLGLAAIGICAAMFAIGWWQGRDLLTMFMTAISLAVAAIPEGLPAIVSIVLAIGVQRMIKQNVIIRKLPAVEALGSVTIICSDKTGTLTQNKMTVTHLYTGGDTTPFAGGDAGDPAQQRLLEALVLCNDATYANGKETGDPTEVALVAAGADAGLLKEPLERAHPRVAEVPFDSERKRMTTVHRYEGGQRALVKGAIDGLLPLCARIATESGDEPLTEERRAAIAGAAEAMSADALRVLAAAYRPVAEGEEATAEALERDLVFLGLVGMIDPPREEVKDSIATCHAAGIRTVMITGDHKDTAFAIAKELGIADAKDQALEGVELDRLSDEDLAARVDALRVFARVSPAHKVRIVDALQAKGNTVSMTGDGVNDAPSLKEADIGVAMGITGTDVAKGAADMVLTDDNFASIVRAVEEGRNIYRNIKKSIVFLLSCNIGEIVALFLAILLGWPTPLRPVHILWVNLITDTAPALSLGVDPPEPGAMKDKPRGKAESLFRGTLPFLLANGALIGALTLGAFVLGSRMYTAHTGGWSALIPPNMTEDALAHAQTMAFAVLSFSQLVHSFNLRSRERSVFQVGLLKNKYLVYSFLFGVALQASIISIAPLAAFFHVHALNWTDWLIVAGFSLVPLVANELWKLARRVGT